MGASGTKDSDSRMVGLSIQDKKSSILENRVLYFLIRTSLIQNLFTQRKMKKIGRQSKEMIKAYTCLI